MSCTLYIIAVTHLLYISPFRRVYQSLKKVPAATDLAKKIVLGNDTMASCEYVSEMHIILHIATSLNIIYHQHCYWL